MSEPTIFDGADRVINTIRETRRLLSKVDEYAETRSLGHNPFAKIAAADLIRQMGALTEALRNVSTLFRQ